MKVRLDKSVAVPAPADAAWRVLGDIEAVAACLPGARIVQRVDERRYKGAVAVKLGPANLTFRGDLEVAELDASTRTLRLHGNGTDNAGGSAAAIDLTARVQPQGGEACELVGQSEVSVSGKAAAFGGRMMDAVADQLLAKFAANFAERVRALQGGIAATGADAAAGAPAGAVGAQAAPAAGATEPGASANATAGAAAGASRPQAVAGATAGATAAAGDTRPAAAAASRAAPDATPSAPAAGAASPATAPAPGGQTARAELPPAEPIDGLALLWAIIKRWLRSLFSARRT